MSGMMTRTEQRTVYISKPPLFQQRIKRGSSLKCHNDNLKPRLSLWARCGCRDSLENLEEIKEHFKKFPRHIVTFTGSLTLQPIDGLNPQYSLKYYESLCSMCQVISKFACGDGFCAYDLTKAVQHLIKSRHRIRLCGTIKSSSNRKKERTWNCLPP